MKKIKKNKNNPRNTLGYDPKYFIGAILDKEFILNSIKDSSITHIDIDGLRLKVCGLRLNTFASNLQCAGCGVIGDEFRAVSNNENHAGEPINWHICLFGNKILMTKDHIIPSSKGGDNSLDNMQTMCTHCNEEKADNV